jgi:hypothetical protein
MVHVTVQMFRGSSGDSWRSNRDRQAVELMATLIEDDAKQSSSTP